MKSRRKSTLLAAGKASLLPVAGAAMLVLCFPPFNYAWLAWIALVPLALTFRLQRLVWLLYGCTYLAGVGFHLATGDWMRTRDGSAGFDSPAAKVWLTIGCVVGVSWLVMLLLGRFLSQRTRWPLAVILPLAWICHEYARRIGTALIDEVGFPWGGLATTQCAHVEWIQIADLAGPYAVAGLIAVAGGALADAACHLPGLLRHGPMAARAVFAPLALAAVLLVGTYGYGTWRLAETDATAGPIVALMPLSGEFDFLASPKSTDAQTDSVDDRKLELYALWTSCTNGADLLLYSEGVLSGFVVGEDARAVKQSPFVRRLEQRARELGAALLIGCTRQDEQGHYLKLCNSTIVVDSQEGYRGYYDKVCLVPWREFTPRIGYDLGIRGDTELSRGESFPVFSVATAQREEPYRVAAAICFDVAFPGVMRAFRRQESAASTPEFFVFSSCEITDATGCLQETLLRMAQLRAVESRRSIVRNVDGGYQALINSNGRVLWRSDRSPVDAPRLVGPVPIDRRASLYAAWGDWLPITAAVVVLCVVLKGRLRRRQPSERRKRIDSTPAHKDLAMVGTRE